MLLLLLSQAWGREAGLNLNLVSVAFQLYSNCEQQQCNEGSCEGSVHFIQSDRTFPVKGSRLHLKKKNLYVVAQIVLESCERRDSV